MEYLIFIHQTVNYEKFQNVFHTFQETTPNMLYFWCSTQELKNENKHISATRCDTASVEIAMKTPSFGVCFAQKLNFISLKLTILEPYGWVQKF